MKHYTVNVATPSTPHPQPAMPRLKVESAPVKSDVRTSTLGIQLFLKAQSAALSYLTQRRYI